MVVAKRDTTRVSTTKLLCISGIFYMEMLTVKSLWPNKRGSPTIIYSSYSLISSPGKKKLDYCWNQIATVHVNALAVCCVLSETHPPICLLTSLSPRPPATSVNCVSRFEGYRERLMFAEEARLALISRGVWDPRTDPRGKKPSRFHTAVHGDPNEPTAAYCHQSPKRKDSKLPCQELWPQCQYNKQPLSLI